MKINYKRMPQILGAALVLSLLVTIVVLAGSIDSPAAPGSTSGFTIEDVYDAVNSDNAHNASPQSAFTEPSSGPGTGTMHSLDEIMTILIGNVPKTGQTICYSSGGSVISCAGTGQDGEKRMGSLPIQSPISSSTTGAYTISTWTGTRFTDNGDGTVTDNVTGLIWLKNANCFGQQDWSTALSSANGLANGSCGLSDASSTGDWRLPNTNELHSLIDRTQSIPALPSGHPFTSVQADWVYYWSSTSYDGVESGAWDVLMRSGHVSAHYKFTDNFIWPVRGGQ